MQPSPDNKASIIRFWQAVELLNLQAIPRTKDRASPYDAMVHDLSRGGALVLPWTPKSRLARMALPKGRAWGHLVYANCFDYRKIVALLEQAFGADNGYQESRETAVSLFALRFNEKGEMLENSLVLSSAAWMAGKILAGQSWQAGFEEAQYEAIQIAAEMLTDVVTPDALDHLADEIVKQLGLVHFFADEPRRYICRSTPIRPNAPEPTDDPLNSFLLDDLASVSSSVAQGISSAPLNAYLSRHEGAARIDLAADESSGEQVRMLLPDRYPKGSWPAPGDLGLVHSQQLAVNAIEQQLLQGSGLLSVNGPPGTGKTTLLRDIVASVVTARADALAKLARPADAFLSRGTVIDADRNRGYWSLHPSLLGHEIVVASSNNGAIENVTLELPQRDKVDARWLDEYDLYADIATQLNGQPAWGLISAALGSKARRGKFVDGFWRGGARRKGGAKPEAPTDDAAGPDSPAAFAQEFATVADAQTEEPISFESWLNGQRKGIPEEEKLALWRDAVRRYQQAAREAATASEDAERFAALIRSREEYRQEASKGQLSVREKADAIDHLERAMGSKTKEHEEAEALLEASLGRVAELSRQRPGLLANLLSFGRARRDWATEEQGAVAQRDLVQGRLRRLEREAHEIFRKLEDLRVSHALAKVSMDSAQRRKDRCAQDAIELADRYGAEHLKAFLTTGVIGRGDAIELAEPWKIPGWRRARSKVFMEALKLHQTLFELESSKVFTNLSLAMVLLDGERYQNMPREAVRSVWGTLFMAVPVLSSTFASFARCFSSFGPGDIGWLLVDEAGQATPQAAVGALWRSRRAVMVGDPLQLEPISQVPAAALEHMRTAFGVDAHWMPHQLSAQRLADQANPIGREIGPDGSKMWVGMPLVVHRRCDRPMFETANRIAYAGSMVYGTSTRSPDTPASLPSGWLDVTGPSNGNWVPSEGLQLDRLIKLLMEEGVNAKSISVITPFGDVIRQVSRGAAARVGSTAGTIHTMQGKEADVVVLVLGGNADPQRPGARSWVVEKPNLLNVAATRAKRRLYVIGDRSDWAKKRYFKQVMDLLPVVDLDQAIAKLEQGRAVEEEASPEVSLS